jgi:hypothetical protein
VEVLYIDNLETFANEWEMTMDDVLQEMEELSEQGVMIRQDAYHLMDRYSSTTAGAGNGLFNHFVADLSNSIFRDYEKDLAVLRKQTGMADSQRFADEKAKQVRR